MNHRILLVDQGEAWNHFYGPGYRGEGEGVNWTEEGGRHRQDHQIFFFLSGFRDLALLQYPQHHPLVFAFGPYPCLLFHDPHRGPGLDGCACFHLEREVGHRDGCVLHLCLDVFLYLYLLDVYHETCLFRDICLCSGSSYAFLRGPLFLCVSFHGPGPARLTYVISWCDAYQLKGYESWVLFLFR
jgi:hypothetical protein